MPEKDTRPGSAGFVPSERTPRTEKTAEDFAMDLFDHLESNKLLRSIEHYLFEIWKILRPKHNPNTTGAAIAFGGSMTSTPGTLAVGTTITATFVPIEADGITQTPGAVLTTPPVYTIDNPAIATIVDNGNGTAAITGVASGTVNVTATGGVFTDSDGTVSAPLTATNTATVPTGRTVTAQINFSAAPSPAPPAPASTGRR